MQKLMQKQCLGHQYRWFYVLLRKVVTCVKILLYSLTLLHSVSQFTEIRYRAICLIVFYTKTRLPQSLLPNIELLKELFPTECKKYFFQNSTKDRMTYFNISVAIKRRRDNSNKFDYIETECTVIAHLLPWSHEENCKYNVLF